MAQIYSPSRYLVTTGALLAALVLAWPRPSLADKPDWAGGKREHRESREQGGGRDRGPADRHDGPDQARVWSPSAPSTSSGVRVDIRIGGYFGEPQRVAVHQAYAPQIRGGNCPPGLAKKGNGCQPPGQAKKAYVLGQPLPPGVVYYDLSPSVSVQLGLPPAGHRFVRVAADILLIAIGTGMVIDAIEDLGR